MPQLNDLCPLLRRLLSWYGIFFGAICTAILLIGSFPAQDRIAQLCAVVYFLLAFLLGWHAKRYGLSSIVFLLPLLPTFNTQVTAVFPSLQLPLAISGIRVISGFVVGVYLQHAVYERKYFQTLSLPGILSLTCVVLTCSVALAVARNLWMSGSVFSFRGLLYNALHFSLNGWRDDYYPLTDLLTFGLAATFMGTIIALLREEKDPTVTLMRPVLWGIIIAALWAMVQNRTGLGLSYSSASGNRYYQMFGYASTGFQPDIHAFSAHMLLGAVGAWGCFFIRKQSLSRWLITAAIVMGWAGLWASKSRGSILLASLIYLLVLAVLLWRKNKLYFFIATTLAFFSASAIYVFHRWGLSIIPLWLIQYVESLPKLHITNLEALNAHFGHRAEIYHAAFRMFQTLPVFGLGQASFYSMSGIQDFAKSRFLGQIQGENAHNYFLQTLTETGLIGTAIFCAAILLPWFKSTSKNNLYPAYVLILAIGLGNLFAHALLVRENFFLLCAVLSLLYAILSRSEQRSTLLDRLSIRRKLSASIIVSLSIVLGLQEVYRSFGHSPYLYGAKCFVAAPLNSNEWTSGMIDIQIPEGTTQIELHLSNVQPDVANNPLGVAVNLLDNKSKIVSSSQLSISQPGAQVLRVPLGQLTQSSEPPVRAKLELSRCFTPRNLGVNTDTRRLGVLLKELVFIKKE